jgi:hypothetical protein
MSTSANRFMVCSIMRRVKQMNSYFAIGNFLTIHSSRGKSAVDLWFPRTGGGSGRMESSFQFASLELRDGQRHTCGLGCRLDQGDGHVRQEPGRDAAQRRGR